MLDVGCSQNQDIDEPGHKRILINCSDDTLFVISQSVNGDPGEAWDCSKENRPHVHSHNMGDYHQETCRSQKVATQARAQNVCCSVQFVETKPIKFIHLHPFRPRPHPSKQLAISLICEPRFKWQLIDKPEEPRRVTHGQGKLQSGALIFEPTLAMISSTFPRCSRRMPAIWSNCWPVAGQLPLPLAFFSHH